MTSPTAFLVDFLPVIRRTLTRRGFVIDHVEYFSNALKPWIERRDQLGTASRIKLQLPGDYMW